MNSLRRIVTGQQTDQEAGVDLAIPRPLAPRPNIHKSNTTEMLTDAEVMHLTFAAVVMRVLDL